MPSFREETEGERVREALRKRTPILQTLREQPHEKPTLVEKLAVSRSTVDRAVDELLDAGLIERTTVGYRATAAGELALDAHQAYIEQTDCLNKASPVLNALPDNATVDPVMLRDCTVSLPKPHAPENAHRPVVEQLEQADRLRGLAPVVRSSYVTLLHDAVFERGLTVEIVTDRSVRKSLTDLVVIEKELKELAASDSFQLFETDERLPYALWLMDGEWSGVGITVHHDSGSTAGVLLNDTSLAVEWGTETYESLRATAAPTTVELESA